MRKLIILLTVVVVTAASGYMLWKYAFGKDDNSQTQTSLTSFSAQAADTWFEIPEWGVKFKLEPELIGDIYYVYRKDSDVVYIKLKSIDSIDHGCGDGYVSSSTALVREDINKLDDLPARGTIKLLGNYRYRQEGNYIICRSETDPNFDPAQADKYHNNYTAVNENRYKGNVYNILTKSFQTFQHL